MAAPLVFWLPVSPTDPRRRSQPAAQCVCHQPDGLAAQPAGYVPQCPAQGRPSRVQVSQVSSLD